MSNARLNQTNLPYSPINGSANGAAKSIFGTSKVTSTPALGTPWRKRLPLATFTSSRLKSPLNSPRYNLSEMGPNTSLGSTDRSHDNSPRPRRIPTVSGPLLASTRFNVNLGTYADSNSPGITSRIVQYEEEKKQDKYIATHQPKYGSPGLFPVVHLFKKEIPVISPKPKRVTVRIANPDSCPYTTQEQNRILMESMVKDPTNITQNGGSGEHDASTRSVLDALKEISRKRIHAGLECDDGEERKRHRKEFANNFTDTSKRVREESPPHGETHQLAKRARGPCIDPMAASYSSSKILEYLMQCTQVRRQMPKSITEKKSFETISINDSESEESSDEDGEMNTTKNVETQTMEEPSKEDKDTSTSMEVDDGPLKNDANSSSIETRSILFDERPMELRMKNKLSSILAGIKGVEPEIELMEKPDLDEDEPKIVSILSPPNKPKHDKHVKFNNEVSYTSSEPILGANYIRDCTTTTASITSPISSSTVTPTKDQVDKPIAECDTPKMIHSAPVVSVTKVLFSDHTGNAQASPSSNDLLKTSSSVGQIPANSTSSGQSLPVFGAPITNSPKSSMGPFAFGSPVSSSTAAPASGGFTLGDNSNKHTSKQETSQPGGFKFDFNKPTNDKAVPTFGKSGIDATTVAETSSSSSVPQFKFGASNSPNPAAMFNSGSNNFNSPSSAFNSTVNTAASTLTFGTTTAGTFSTPSSLFNSPAKSTAPSFGSTSISTFGGVSSSISTKPNTITSPSTFAQPGGTPSSTSTLMFGNSNNLPSFGNSPAPPYSSVVTTASGFGAPATTSSGFGATVTTTPGFGGATPGFGAAPTTSSTFGPPTTASSIFGNSSSTVSAFTIPSTTTAMFNNPTTTASVFGAATTSAPVFGGSTPSAFGTPASTAPGFGGPSNTPAAFGGPTTTPSAFGQPPSASNMFGPTQANSPPFGSTTNAAFGTTPSFASSTAPTFGNAGGSTFGTGSTPAFGGNNNSGFPATTTTSAPGFGTNTTTSTFAFGKSAPPSFPATTASSVFGPNSASAFGKVNGFGTNPTTSAPTFGNNTPAFGATTTASSFGSNTSFGTTTTSANGFASPGFGSSNFNPNSSAKPAFGTAAPSNVFSFGAKNTTAPFGATSTTSAPAFGENNSSTFTFGGPTTQPSTTSAFNAGFGNASTTTAASGFGTNTTPAFGSNTAAPPFGGSTPAFGGATPGFGSSGQTSTFGSGNAGFGATAGTFGNNNNASSFGSPAGNNFGTSSGFGATAPNNNNNNNTFGSNNAFGGGAPANGFGTTPSQNPPAFGAASPQQGVFSFGTASSAPPNASGGVFAFGSAADKPKTGGFNFTAGATPAASPFGGSAAGFSATPNAPPQFNNPTPGMFSIGSGSSSGRPRPHLKAKRRP